MSVLVTVWFSDPLEPHLLVQVHAVLAASGGHEGPVEEVSIVCDVDGRLHLTHVREEAVQQRKLVGLIKDLQGASQESKLFIGFRLYDRYRDIA